MRAAIEHLLDDIDTLKHWVIERDAQLRAKDEQLRDRDGRPAVARSDTLALMTLIEQFKLTPSQKGELSVTFRCALTRWTEELLPWRSAAAAPGTPMEAAA